MIRVSSVVRISIYKFCRILNENFFSILFGKRLVLCYCKWKRKIIYFENEVIKKSDLLLTGQNETLKISGQSFCS